jgi:hypothetical protein
MKFYKSKNLYKIRKLSLTAIYDNFYYVQFFKNGKNDNAKNAAYIDDSGYKEFYLNGKLYGDEDDFTKESWRRFVKLQAFL